MLNALNRRLEKAMPLITPVSVLIGVLLGSYLSGYAYLSTWIFAFITFSGSISSNVRDFFTVIRRPVPLILTMLILHVLIPLLALVFGHVFFTGDDFTITGLVLAVAIPTGISSFIWVSIYKGNTVLTLAIILVDTLLSPLIVPLTLSLLVGANVEMDSGAIMKSLFVMVVLPSILGMLLNEWTRGQIKVKWGPRLSPFSKLGMGVVVAINGSVVAPYLRSFDSRLLLISAVILTLACSGYATGFLTAKLLRWDQDIVVAMTFNGGMRNISAGAVLAVSYFPAPVAVPVVLGMLFQQLTASLWGYILAQRKNHNNISENANIRQTKVS
ncbi:bile acid:sodium symporter family protein [Paenibacillus wynnii]|uniref:bile acid:sodium symporter family protein n=1 Tax=Paenibacillus wynnii TaxID=268407 RepID=UPI00278CE63F|nr:bile acid:sodium symporter family protein [Paenibacillus wynnii]MDQ0194475.1 putative Na+-dependent transporter [Paenibacillus wynnii]